MNPFDPTHPAGRLSLGCLFEGGLLLVALVAGWIVDVNPLATFAWNLSEIVAGLVAVVPMVGMLWWGLRFPGGTVGKVTLQAREFVVQFLSGIGWPGFALISALAGIGEEALFRGLLQTFLTGQVGLWAGILIASVLFGLAHAVSRTYAVIASFIGIYLGLLYVITGGIVAPIICHAVYDFIALVFLASSVRKQ